MKQLIILLFTISVFSACKKEEALPSSQTPEAQPTYFSYNGQIGTNDNSTIISNDNNVLICGNLISDLSILKLDLAGNELWRKDFSTGNGSSASGIAETSINELFICGSTSKNYSTSKNDILLIKTNSSGDTIWSKTYGGVESEYGTNIIPTSDGNILISGKTESFGAGSFGDIYLIKVNTNGDTLWTKSYPDQDQDQEVPFNLLETSDGGYLVTGTNEDNSNPRGLYLLKVNSSGNKLWDNTIGAGLWKWGYSTIELANGDLITVGQYTTGGYSQVLVLKSDNQGNTIWEKQFGESNLSEKGYSIKENMNNTYTITGSSYDVNTTQDDIIVFNIDANGNQLWFKKFGSTVNDWGANIVKGLNDENVITGGYNGNIFMTKLNNNGEFE